LKEINIEATSPLKQPAQAPKSSSSGSDTESDNSAKKKIRFGPPPKPQPQYQSQSQPTTPRTNKPQLSWPNNIPLKPRKKAKSPECGPDQSATPARHPNPFQSNTKRTQRMANSSPTRPNNLKSPSSPRSNQGPIPDPNTYWDPNSNWRTPVPKPAVKPAIKPANKKERWDKDSKWTPPSKARTTPTPARPRTPRSTVKPVHYNED
jgi:hypothetical protein